MFNQPAPQLANQYDDDRVLTSYLKRALPSDVMRTLAPLLTEMGHMAAHELYTLQLADRLNEPTLTQWDPWGHRIDHIEVSPLWKVAEKIAAEYGVVALGYDPAYGEQARTAQFALAYLFHPSTDLYTCPLAMTDGAARALLESGNRPLIERAVPRLTSRDAQTMWTSGQWMTESTGGSDVGQTETVARLDENGEWRLYGRKWFTSATTSQMALALARPEGNPPGGSGLALFYVETRDEQGRLADIHVNRLKEKLGTRKVPTAELMLEGVRAVPVMGLSHGTRAIIPMLHITRTWNSVMAVSFMRRGIALARDYARKRSAFGAPLAHKALHADTLATLQAEMEAAFHLSFYLVELLGRQEQGQLADEEHSLLRLLTSVAKLTTGRQAVDVLGEVIEAFGGAGYIEDTGIPALLRDSHVLPIWEGTTNVLALDSLRALSSGNALAAYVERARRAVASASDPGLQGAGSVALAGLANAEQWWRGATGSGRQEVEFGARRFALTLGRALALALLVEHAQWALTHEQDTRPRAAALRFAQTGIDLIRLFNLQDAFRLANDDA